MEETEDLDVMDAGLTAAARAIEHYEIARYGTRTAWADQLGLKDASRLFGETLDAEKKTDQLLSQLAVSHLNREAA